MKSHSANHPDRSAGILAGRAASVSKAARIKRVEASLASSAENEAAKWRAALRVSCSVKSCVSAVPSIPLRRAGAFVGACNDKMVS